MDIKENMIRLIQYYNPTQNENNQLKNDLHEILLIERTYIPQSCCVPKCNRNPIESHEITKGLFLKPLADQNKKINIINHNFSGNIRQLKIKKEHIDRATTFWGFCDQCDKNLFKSFEDGNDFQINDDFIHKQCLRTVAKEIYLLEKEIYLLSKIIEQKEKSKKLAQFLISKQRKNLTKYRNIFHKIYISIERSSKCLIYTATTLSPKEICFAKMKYDSFLFLDVYTFLFLIFHGNQLRCILATLDNIWSKQVLKPAIGKFELNGYCLQNKERFVFSDSYLASLSFVERISLEEDNKVIGNIFCPNFLS